MDRFRAVEGDLTAAGGLRSAIGAPGGSAAIQIAHEMEELRIQKQKLQQESKVLETQVRSSRVHTGVHSSCVHICSRLTC